MNKILLLICAVLASAAVGQNAFFPQAEVNSLTQKALAAPKSLQSVQPARAPSGSSLVPVMKKIGELKSKPAGKMFSPAWLQVGDTIIVGATPNDTLKITGNWTHEGPILVLGDGVLIFKNATVIDTGDIYVFQNGSLFADSSSLTFPQQYFYQRSLIAAGSASVQITNSSFNYSGLSHNLVIADSATVSMSQITQNDWTTCGLFGKPAFNLDGCNLSGEYILIDSCSADFRHADSLILWHHIPGGASVNSAFPPGDSVYNYAFNNTLAGVSGIRYDVTADSCHTVWWALMPENNSNVVISNSTLRLIGAWFRYNDTVTVSGLSNNSSYANFTAPLADRNLQLINTDVQTWSLYVFDNSHIDLFTDTVGEVGTQQKATVTQANPFLLDGSGGYYWCTDSSGIISFGATVYSYVRSEKNGLFIYAYGWSPFTAPQAIGKSMMVCIQCYSAADPVYYDAATAWMNKLDGPDTASINAIVPVTGSAWIDRAGVNSWPDFQSYSLYYQQSGDTTWSLIVKDSMAEQYHANLGNWSTAGLSTGDYNLRLVVKTNYGDSVDAVMPVHLLPGSTSLGRDAEQAFRLFPNPTRGTFLVEGSERQPLRIEVYNALGALVQQAQGGAPVDVSHLDGGIYFVKVFGKTTPATYRLVKQ